MLAPLFLIAAQVSPATPAEAPLAADRIYTGGTILTMLEEQPRAEALALAGGRLLAVGTHDEVLRYRSPATEIVDLGGRALLPGFYDAHGHVVAVGMQATSANLLAPPDGEVRDLASLQDELRRWAAASGETVAATGLILGFGYDDGQLAEERHPTRDDLDAVSTELPVYAIHQSGHLGAANSVALALCGLDADSEDPPGGVIRRRAGSREPDGVLEETAHFAALQRLLGGTDARHSITTLRAGINLLARFGYTTAEEGRAPPEMIDLLRAAAAEESFPIDVVAYPDVLIDREFIAREVNREYRNGFRVAGAKLTIDGSPQGFTAWRDRPYHRPPAHFRAGHAGYPAASADEVFDAVAWAFEHDIQVITHANGEAAIDQLLAAIEEATRRSGGGDRRSVLIHGQFLRRDQVGPLQRLGIVPSLFPMHTFYWGDWHRERTVGPERADDISPTGWLVERGMPFSTHHDAPVALPDSMRVLDATVTRRTRSGDILGPTHRVDVLTALRAMTIWPAWHHFEEDHKGTLEAGKLADLVILSADPTAVDPETLDSLRVLETIKAGRTVYRAD
ncbi:MAG: amidohydrolase [Planctomycetota bacterium]